MRDFVRPAGVDQLQRKTGPDALDESRRTAAFFAES
jgi:hypothetical protein